MSADLLRRAAEAMRRDDDRRWHSVADWLLQVAERQKPTVRYVGRSHGWTGSVPANAVARAYLGDGGATDAPEGGDAQ